MTSGTQKEAPSLFLSGEPSCEHIPGAFVKMEAIRNFSWSPLASGLDGVWGSVMDILSPTMQPNGFLWWTANSIKFKLRLPQKLCLILVLMDRLFRTEFKIIMPLTRLCNKVFFMTMCFSFCKKIKKLCHFRWVILYILIHLEDGVFYHNLKNAPSEWRWNISFCSFQWWFLFYWTL